MMSVARPLLLCLLSALVEIHSQTVPYVSFMGTNLPNHSYVDLTRVGSAEDGSDGVQCRTDLLTCCRTAQGSHRGDWYSPNEVRLNCADSPGDIYEVRGAQRVDLRRRGNNITSGVYRCTIAYSNWYSLFRQGVVYVGLYISGGKHVRGNDERDCSRLVYIIPFFFLAHYATLLCSKNYAFAK